MTDIGFSRTYYTKMPYPYSTCASLDSTSFNSTYYTYTKKVSGYYSQKLCYELCLQFEFIKPNCSCTDPSIMIVTRDDPVCNTMAKLSCVATIRSRFDTASLADSCSSYCPEQCERFEYTTSVSMSDYPSEYYYNVIGTQPNVMQKYATSGQTMTFNLFKYSMLMVNVFYSDIRYGYIAESATLT